MVAADLFTKDGKSTKRSIGDSLQYEKLPGMNGDLEICPGPGYIIAVLSNVDPPAAGRVSHCYQPAA